MRRLTGLVLFSTLIILAAAGCTVFGNTGTPISTPTQSGPLPSQSLLPTNTSSPSLQPSPSLPQVTSTPQPSPTPPPSSTPALLPSTGQTVTPTASPTSLPASSQTPNPSATSAQVPSVTATAMLPSPTPTNAPSASATPGDTSGSAQTGCIDKAAFSDDVTFPDDTLVKPGQHFTKIWKIHNEGTCDWHAYSLIYAGGDAMNSPMASPIQDVKVNEYANISIDLVASTRGGPDIGYWEFKNAAGQTFGVGSGAQGLLWTKVTVDYPTVVPTSSGQNQNPSSTPAAGSSSSTSGNCTYSLNDAYVTQILNLINTARAQNGLKPLTLNPKLNAAALAHSMDMACNDFVSHDGTDGSTWYDRIKARGYANYTSARENIYVGSPDFGGDAQGAFTWWMNSKIHHDNILYPTATEVGIAYVFTANSSYGGYYTLDLARH